MKTIYHENVATIGNRVILPGTISVNVYGNFCGCIVDRKGSLFVIILGTMSISKSYINIALIVELIIWFTTIMLIFLKGE